MNKIILKAIQNNKIINKIFNYYNKKNLKNINYMTTIKIKKYKKNLKKNKILINLLDMHNNLELKNKMNNYNKQIQIQIQLINKILIKITNNKIIKINKLTLMKELKNMVKN